MVEISKKIYQNYFIGKTMSAAFGMHVLSIGIVELTLTKLAVEG